MTTIHLLTTALGTVALSIALAALSTLAAQAQQKVKQRKLLRALHTRA
ncbi:MULTISPECIES: hypothetical protein [unclassified Xanthobacter]|nr:MULTISPECIES: hypothetical protein [unclassified Xanthobacter]